MPRPPIAHLTLYEHRERDEQSPVLELELHDSVKHGEHDAGNQGIRRFCAEAAGFDKAVGSNSQQATTRHRVTAPWPLALCSIRSIVSFHSMDRTRSQSSSQGMTLLSSRTFRPNAINFSVAEEPADRASSYSGHMVGHFAAWWRRMGI